MTAPLTVMLVAAEASGDTLGAGLARALKARLGGADGVRLIGVGGARMAAEGIESPFDIAELSIMGWTDALRAAPRVLRRIKETVALAEREKPDVAVLIDSWGFTVRVAKALRQAMPDLPLVKYVAPQVWASRPKRAKVLAGAVDHLLAIHPFDAEWFEREGLPTTFVGNPALATDFSGADGARFRDAIDATPDEPVLLVLPGSRTGEIKRLMPPFEAAITQLKQTHPDLKVAVVAAHTVADQVKGRVAGWPFRASIIEGEGPKRDAMAGATVALACSGTVSTELARAGCAIVIAYRLDPVSYQIVRRAVMIKYATLFNLAAQAYVAPEFLQDEATGPKLAAALAERLDDPVLRAAQIKAQYDALEKMGRADFDPFDKAAEALIDFLEMQSVENLVELLAPGLGASLRD
jgi:lipid-A-disaccharide synthase